MLTPRDADPNGNPGCGPERTREDDVAGADDRSMRAVQRMNALDTWFLHIEDEADHMHIGSVGVFEGPAPAWEELRDSVASKLDRLPRYRQRVQHVPLRIARPVWVDDPHFRLEYHVRHTALPSPGGVEELRNLVGRVMSQQLDRNRPLWEMWFIEGLGDGRWAMLSKVHHCMVDGIAGTDLLAIVLEDRADAPHSTPAPWKPAEEPGPLRLLRDAAIDVVTQPADVLRTLRGKAQRPRELATRTLGGLQGTAGIAEILKPMPRTSLTGPIGPHRRWVPVWASLGDIKMARKALGGTVNDVVLSAITSGYRELLADRGELTDDVEVRTMVPVSLRTAEQRGEYHNRVAAMFVSLPVTIDDPIARHEAMLEEMERIKGSGEQVTVAALVGFTGVAPAMFVGVALRSTTWLVQHRGQPFVSTVTTNVPGPQTPWFLLGRRLLETYPYVPIGEGIRTGIAIFSYDGQLTFGVTADYDEVPDVDVLADGIGRGVAELVALGRGEPADGELNVRAPLATAPAAAPRARASRRGTAGG
jgi:diacylglycerol O-acyltransferase / wax synthase